MPKKSAKSTTPLNAKQARFVQEYIIDLNGNQAAIRAGYSEKTAYSQANRLLKDERIKAAIKKAMDDRSERTEITQDYVLRNIKEITERCMQAIPVTDRNGQMVFVENADGILCPAFTFDARSALRGNELMGKHKGMFKDKVDHNHSGMVHHKHELDVMRNIMDEIDGKTATLVEEN